MEGALYDFCYELLLALFNDQFDDEIYKLSAFSESQTSPNDFHESLH